jgi:hypothetical protein
MGLHSFNAKRDLNERPIIDALRASGATVQQLSIKGCPDLLVGFTDPETGEPTNYLMEIKGEKGKLTSDEEAWIDKWKGQVFVVYTVEQALEIIGR